MPTPIIPVPNPPLLFSRCITAQPAGGAVVIGPLVYLACHADACVCVSELSTGDSLRVLGSGVLQAPIGIARTFPSAASTKSPALLVADNGARAVFELLTTDGSVLSATPFSAFTAGVDMDVGMPVSAIASSSRYLAIAQGRHVRIADIESKAPLVSIDATIGVPVGTPISAYPNVSGIAIDGLNGVIHVSRPGRVDAYFLNDGTHKSVLTGRGSLINPSAIALPSPTSARSKQMFVLDGFVIVVIDTWDDAVMDTMRPCADFPLNPATHMPNCQPSNICVTEVKPAPLELLVTFLDQAQCRVYA